MSLTPFPTSKVLVVACIKICVLKKIEMTPLVVSILGNTRIGPCIADLSQFYRIRLYFIYTMICQSGLLFFKNNFLYLIDREIFDDGNYKGTYTDLSTFLYICLYNLCSPSKGNARTLVQKRTRDVCFVLQEFRIETDTKM